MKQAKKILLRIMCIFFLLVIVNAQSLTDYQKHLEQTVQNALDRILGQDNSIVYISLIGDSEKWEIRYTSVPQIDGVNLSGSGGTQQTIVPGIPSLRFLTQGSSGEGVPLNYEIVQRPPFVRNKDVVLILDNKIKMGDLRAARTFVTKFLELDENAGDKLTILRENFSTIQRAERSASTVTSQKRINWLPIIVISVIVLLLVIIGIVLMKLLPFKDKKEKDSAGKTDSDSLPQEGMGSGRGGGGAAEKGAGGSGTGGESMDALPPEHGGSGEGGGERKLSEAEKKKKEEEKLKQQEEDAKKKEEEEKLFEMQKGILGNGERYFNFIDEENVYKLKFLLQVKIALQQANPRTIAVVMSCLPFKLAASILVEYPPKIQAEIVNNIIFLQHYPENEMQELENEIKENIEYLFGGKNRLKLIIERIPGEDKKKILSIISSKYPGIADEINSLIFLFDDLLKQDTSVIARVFSDIDTEVIATALVHIETERQKLVISTLAKGVQSMVDQWLALKSNTASKFEVEEARQKVLSYAQHLEREGFIELKNG